jgi:site-specific DNA-cytosine methylase
MRILLACEESQTVTKAFRALGHEAYSCDILPASGGYQQWHIQKDVVEVLKDQWDMIIAFPPCTHLASSGAAWFEAKRADGRQQQAIDFFMIFANHPCEKIAIENPVGIMSSRYRKPNQIIQPWQFGDSYSKRTCLWLKGLPNLVPTDVVDPGEMVTFDSGRTMPKWYADAWKLSSADRSKARSKTFPGIAAAMAKQWGVK